MLERPLAPENQGQVFIYYALGARTASFFVGLSTFTYGVTAIMNKRLLWVVLACLSVAACGKKEEPKAKPKKEEEDQRPSPCCVFRPESNTVCVNLCKCAFYDYRE